MAFKENIVQAQILSYLHHRRILAWRNNNVAVYDPKTRRYRAFTGLRGVSDILGVLPGGRILAIECKSKTGKLSPDQIKFIDKINSTGGLAFLARSIEDVKAQGL